MSLFRTFVSNLRMLLLIIAACLVESNSQELPCQNMDGVTIEAVYTDNGFKQYFIQGAKPEEAWLHVVDKDGFSYTDKLDEKNLTLGFYTGQKEWTNGEEKTFLPSAIFKSHASEDCEEKVIYEARGNKWRNMVIGEINSYFPAKASSPFKLYQLKEKKAVSVPDGNVIKIISVTPLKEVEQQMWYKIVFTIKEGNNIQVVSNVVSMDKAGVVTDNESGDKIEQHSFGDLLTEFTEETTVSQDSDTFVFGYQIFQKLAIPVFYSITKDEYKEYPMRLKDSNFNGELTQLTSIPEVPRYVVPVETLLGCPFDRFCLGNAIDAVVKTKDTFLVFAGKYYYTTDALDKQPKDPNLVSTLSPYNEFFRINTAFLTDDITWYYLVDKYLCISSGEKKVSGKVSQLLPKLEADGDTKAFYDKEQLYVFGGSTVYKYQLKSATGEKDMKINEASLVEQKTFTDVNTGLPEAVDTVFVNGDQLVAIRRHFVIEMPLSDFFNKKLEGKPILMSNSKTKYFGCDFSKLDAVVSKEFWTEYENFANPATTAKAEKKA